MVKRVKQLPRSGFVQPSAAGLGGKARRSMMRTITSLPVVVWLAMLSVALAGCVSQRAAIDDKAFATVQRYVAKTKHWKPAAYRIEKHGQARGCTVCLVLYLADLKSRHPGGGESFLAYYDPSKRKVVKPFYFQ